VAIVAQVGQQLQKIVKKLHDALKVQGKEHEPGLRQKLVRALRLQKLLAPTIPVALQACVPALTQAAHIRAAKAATEILNNFTSFNSLEQTRALIRAEAQIQTPEQARALRNRLTKAAVYVQLEKLLRKTVEKLHHALEMLDEGFTPSLRASFSRRLAPSIRYKLSRVLHFLRQLTPVMPPVKALLQIHLPTQTQARVEAQTRLATKIATKILNEFISFGERAWAAQARARAAQAQAHAAPAQAPAQAPEQAPIQTLEQAHDLETLELIVAYTLVQRFGSDSGSG
jgi:hypothetical protein